MLKVYDGEMIGTNGILKSTKEIVIHRDDEKNYICDIFAYNQIFLEKASSKERLSTMLIDEFNFSKKDVDEIVKIINKNELEKEKKRHKTRAELRKRNNNSNER